MTARAARLGGALVLFGALMFAGGAAGCQNEDTVDGKGSSPVPGTAVVCFWLEVETTTPSGDDAGELTYCADKAEWDRNREGSPWVDANGKPK